jgi:hypothetical protein
MLPPEELIHARGHLDHLRDPDEPDRCQCVVPGQPVDLLAVSPRPAQGEMAAGDSATMAA